MEFYGLLGEKLGYSISPQIHSKIFSQLKVEAAYKIFEVPKEELKYVTQSMRVLGIKGMNVTIPYKKDIMKYLDSISDEASKIGAVNTVLLKDGKLEGHNTDYFGFGKILERNDIDIEKKIVMVLGTGGASQAVMAYLLNNNIEKIYLVSRSKTKKKIYDENKVEYVTYDEISNIKGEIIINTTPVGTYPNVDKSPVDKNIISNFNVLVDIIYNPSKTKFLKMGEELNKKACGGLEMLVGQAIKSEEIWQDKCAKEDVFNYVYKEISKEFRSI